jgi:uncharacterized membrane protein YidH (DUF202 family)
MKKRGNRHKIKKIRKANKLENWFILGFSLLLFIVGLIKLLFFSPSVAVNAHYLQPTIDNGGVISIAGLVLLICSIYRFSNKEKIIKDTIDLEKSEL